MCTVYLLLYIAIVPPNSELDVQPCYAFMDRLVTVPLRSVSDLLKITTPLENAPSLLFPVNNNAYYERLQEPQKILVCHDMRGNYLNDKYINGAAFENAFQIFDFESVHLFCYFSHELVSIPPLSWINCCRTHGVRALGTLLTEWDDGAGRCHDMFGSKEAALRTASSLAAVAVSSGVDGWLINIENKLEPIELVDNVINFLTALTSLMHAAVPNSVVLWYDAVTTEGKLRWQDTLNELNRPFAAACDGLFVNYTWRSSTPVTVMQYLRHISRGSVSGDSDRTIQPSDVYFGCDVFGRGTAFGGGYDSHLAVSCAMQEGASMAIFAPGWVLENCVSDDSSCHTFACIQNSLILASKRLWNPISVARRKICGGSRVKSYSALPVYTSFSLGAGKFVFVAGNRHPHWGVRNTCSKFVSNCSFEAFYDLSMQDFRFNTDILSDTFEWSILRGDGYRWPAVATCTLTSDVACIGTSSLCLSISMSATDLDDVAAQENCRDYTRRLAQAAFALVKPSALITLQRDRETPQKLILSAVMTDDETIKLGFRIQILVITPDTESCSKTFLLELYPSDAPPITHIDGTTSTYVFRKTAAGNCYNRFESNLPAVCNCPDGTMPVPELVRWFRHEYEIDTLYLAELAGSVDAIYLLEEVQLTACASEKLALSSHIDKYMYIDSFSLTISKSTESRAEVLSDISVVNAYTEGSRLVYISYFFALLSMTNVVSWLLESCVM